MPANFRAYAYKLDKQICDEMGKVERIESGILQYTHSLGQHGAHKF